jgi:hypothetical protein
LTRADELVKSIRDKDELIDKNNINTEKLPEYAQKIIAEFILKLYNFEVNSGNQYEVITEFLDNIRPHLCKPYLPVQALNSKDARKS